MEGDDPRTDVMELSTLCSYCLAKPGASDSRPFGPGALVMKVCGKIFAIIVDEADPPAVSLKCEPEVADALRQTYPSVVPGYHLNKRHWNTVALDGSIPADELRGWVDDSYDLVVDGLPRRMQASLGRR